MRVADYLAGRLVAAGITDVFMISGGGAMHLNDAIGNTPGLRYWCTHHEQAAAMAAEGYYRATGKMAAVCVTCGPGGLNTLTGLAGQYYDSIPCIYLSGQVKRETQVSSYNYCYVRQLGDQETDIVSVVKPLTKYAHKINSLPDVTDSWLAALREVTRGRLGPVWLDVPLDIQAMEMPSTNACLIPNPPPVGVSDLLLDQAIDRLLAMLKDANRPVFLAGHGIRLAQAVPEFLQVIERLRIPVLTTFNGYDLIDSEHPCYIGRPGALGNRAGNFALQNSDLMLAVGARLGIRQVSFNWKGFARKAWKFAVDLDSLELSKPTCHIDYAVHCDAKRFLQRLLDRMDAPRAEAHWPPGWYGAAWYRPDTTVATPAHVEWLDWNRVRRDKYPTVLPDYSARPDGVHPYFFLQELTRQLPETAIVVAGDGTACVGLFQAGIVKQGQRQFWNSGCASMGYDLPAAVGASIATLNGPNKGEVICIAGDGSLQMNVQELQTIAHHQLPIKIFVLDNGGYLSIKQTQDQFFGRRVACDINSGVSTPSVKGLAEAYKIPFSHVIAAGHVSLALRECLWKLLQEPGPMLIWVMCTQDYQLSPKLSSVKLPDGSMVTQPLENMWPFLPREELLENMLIDLPEGI